MLILFVALVGYTLYFLGSARLKADIKRKSQNDMTVVAATANIRSLLSSPANCNATFKGIAAGATTLSSIKKCNGTNNCYSGPNGFGNGIESVVIPVVGGSTWAPGATGIEQGNVRLIGITFGVIRPQTMVLPAIIQLTFRFEKRLRDAATPVTSIVETKLDQYVVFDTPTRSTTIVGCPRNPNTVDVFGDRACHRPWDYDQMVMHNAGVTAYRVQQIVGCSFPGNVETRNCTDTNLSGTFMFASCINDGGWSASSTPFGSCVCVSNGNGLRTYRRTCNNPSPDPGGLPCPPAGEFYQVACTMPLAICPP